MSHDGGAGALGQLMDPLLGKGSPAPAPAPASASSPQGKQRASTGTAGIAAIPRSPLLAGRPRGGAIDPSPAALAPPKGAANAKAPGAVRAASPPPRPAARPSDLFSLMEAEKRRSEAQREADLAAAQLAAMEDARKLAAE